MTDGKSRPACPPSPASAARADLMGHSRSGASDELRPIEGRDDNGDTLKHAAEIEGWDARTRSQLSVDAVGARAQSRLAPGQPPQVQRISWQFCMRPPISHFVLTGRQTRQV